MIEFNTNVFINNPIFDQVRSPGMQELGQGVSQLLAGAASLLQTAAQIIQSGGMHQFGPEIMNNPFTPIAPPNVQDSGPPEGSLSTKDGVVTTPGGYKIEPMGQYEWQITGPDGKSTRVWGDPHVAEGDGGKWDFKRDSTFVLGDGTRINVATKPYNDMTVTSGLEIIAGNDRVNIDNIDKGKGQIGDVTHDGFQRVNAFGGKDVFVMGQETDDWSFQGKEIIGSEKGGESFKLGQDLAPLVQKPNNFGGADAWAKAIGDALSKALEGYKPPLHTGFNPYGGGGGFWQGPQVDTGRVMDGISKALGSIGDMFDGLQKMFNLSDDLALASRRAQWV
jgi:hypothetical protein